MLHPPPPRNCARPLPRRPLPPVAAAPTSFPPYTVVAKTPAYDLRLYSAHAVARTPYMRRDEGFERLGTYLAGANAAGARFADAQPVVMAHPGEAGGGKMMSVHVPPLRDGSPCPSPPPAPTDPSVSLAATGGEVVAVTKLTGYATPGAVDAARSQLAAALAADGVTVVPGSGFRVAQYGPLFTMEERTNEVMLCVQVG